MPSNPPSFKTPSDLPEIAFRGDYVSYMRSLHPELAQTVATVLLRMLAHLRVTHKDDGDKLKSLAWLEDLASLSATPTTAPTRVVYQSPPE